MKWSKFIYKAETKNGIVLFNTTNTAIVSFDRDSFVAVEKAIDSNDVNNDVVCKLLDMNYIVNDFVDETQDLLKETWDAWENDDLLKIVLLSTTGCNFSCAYCYENGINRSLILTKEMGIALLKYVEGVLQSHTAIKNIYLLLFGGEPTLNWSTTIEIAKNIMAMCENYKIDFSSGIVTNGYLLDCDHITDLIAIKCDSIQVTLDGPKYIHDARRHLRSGAGTFDTIIENMRKALDSGCVHTIDLRINVDTLNRDSIEELLCYLSKVFASDELSISFGIISDTINTDDVKQQIAKIPDDILAEELCSLFEIAEKYGFEAQEFYSFDGICILKSRYSFALSPDGRIYRCLSMIGREDLSVCRLQDADPRVDLPSYFNKQMYETCIAKNCEFLPLCHTGCKFDAIVEHGTIEKNSCKYEQYCAVNRYLMQRMAQKGDA